MSSRDKSCKEVAWLKRESSAAAWGKLNPERWRVRMDKSESAPSTAVGNPIRGWDTDTTSRRAKFGKRDKMRDTKIESGKTSAGKSLGTPTKRKCLT
jgi:hypothetical protein